MNEKTDLLRNFTFSLRHNLFHLLTLTNFIVTGEIDLYDQFCMRAEKFNPQTKAYFKRKCINCK